MPTSINTDVDTAPVPPSNSGGEVTSFRQARTPKHCNKSVAMDERNPAPGVQGYPPSPYHRPGLPPPPHFHGQRHPPHGMTGPLPPNHYPSPTNTPIGNPGSGAYGLAPPSSFFGPPPSSVMVSPGRNAYGYNNAPPNVRGEFSRDQFNPNNGWNHDQFPPFNSGDKNFNPNANDMNDSNPNEMHGDFDGGFDNVHDDPHGRPMGSQYNEMAHGNGFQASTSHTDFTRAVSSSFTDSVKSKSSEKESNRKIASANNSFDRSNSSKNVLHLDKEEPDDASIGSRADSDRSWKALNQVASIDDEKFRKEEKDRGSTPVDSITKNGSFPHASSETSSLSNSPSITSRRKDDSNYPSVSAPSKLAPLQSLVNVASMQEALDTSESREADVKRNIPEESPPDLMNCADGSSGSLLFRARDDILTKRPREEERGDIDTMQKSDDEIRRAPSNSSPPNVANLSMTERDDDGSRPSKKSRGGRRPSENGHLYDKPPSYTFSIDSVPSFTKEGLRSGPSFNMRTDSMSTSSLTPLEPIAGRDDAFKHHKEDVNPDISSNMPSWEITGQDSFGGAMTVASNGSGGEGGPLLATSFSFNNDRDVNNDDAIDPPSNFPLRGSMHPRDGFDKKAVNPEIPSHEPEMESRNQSFEETMHQRERRMQPPFNEHMMNHPARADNLDIGYSENSPPPPLRHVDTIPPQGKQDMNRLPRASPHEGKYQLQGAPWNGGNHLRPSQSFPRDPPEPFTQHHPNGPPPTHPGPHNGPYHVSHSGSFGGPPGRMPSFDGGPMHRNFSQESGRSSSPGSNHYHNLRGAGSFGGPPPPPHHPVDHHLPHAFRPPPPDFSKHPHHLNRRPPPAVYIMSSPSGGRVGNPRHSNEQGMKRPGGVYSWTKEDDVRLTEIMKKYKNPKDWEPIAKEFGGGKTSKECHERWIRYLKPGVRKGQWQDHEDAIVVEAVTTSTEQPFTRWSDLAQRLPGRVGKQIRDRWVNHLNPNINHMPFTREDDLKLWDGHQKLGKRWVEISTKYFQSSRSENHIKNRWYSASFKKFVASEFGKDAYNNGKKEKGSNSKNSKGDVMKVEL